MRRTVGLLLTAGMLASGLLGGASAGAAPAEEQHCRVRVLGQQPSGELIMSEVTCVEAPAAPAAAAGSVGIASTLAAHFDGLGWAGAVLTVEGSTCNGGWWNLPSAWNDRISSTLSFCTVRHYINLNLGGSYENTYSPGSNLTWANNAASSIRYMP